MNGNNIIEKFEFKDNFEIPKEEFDDPEKIYQRALVDAKRGIEAELLSEVSSLSLKIERLLQQQDQMLGELANDTAKLTFAIVTKIFDKYSKEKGYIYDICALIKESILSQGVKSKLRIKLSPSISNQVKLKLEDELPENIMKQIDFEDNPNFDESACRIDWGDGGVERSSKEILSRIQDVFEKISKNQDLNMKLLDDQIKKEDEQEPHNKNTTTEGEK